MTIHEIIEIWYKQLSYDYSCTAEELKSRAPVLKKKAYHPNRRIFRGDDCFLKILVVGGKLVVNADDESFLIKNCSFFESADAAWFFEPDNIRALDKMLAEYGHEVADAHHFYLPLGISLKGIPAAGTEFPKQEATVAERYLTEQEETCVNVFTNTGALHIYEKEELEIFRGDIRFKEALSFIETSPDMLAVTWEEKGEILGMAGASADCKDMWQRQGSFLRNRRIPHPFPEGGGAVRFCTGVGRTLYKASIISRQFCAACKACRFKERTIKYGNIRDTPEYHSSVTEIQF